MAVNPRLCDIGSQEKIPTRVDLIAIDLDGTLLDARPGVAGRAESAIREAVAKTRVVIATGRTYRSTLPWAERFHVCEPLICYQGALIREVAERGRTLREVPLQRDLAVQGVELARANNWHRQLYYEDRLICEEDRPEAGIYTRISGINMELVPDLMPYLVQGTTKLVCVLRNSEEVVRCFAEMERTFAGRAYVTRSRPEFVEVLNKAVSKGEALQWLAQRWGVAREHTVAIGDAANDIPMLDFAGFAIATANSDDAVLSRADCTCAPPESGGVADVLQRLGLAR